MPTKKRIARFYNCLPQVGDMLFLGKITAAWLQQKTPKVAKPDTYYMHEMTPNKRVAMLFKNHGGQETPIEEINIHIKQKKVVCVKNYQEPEEGYSFGYITGEEMTLPYHHHEHTYYPSAPDNDDLPF